MERSAAEPSRWAPRTAPGTKRSVCAVREVREVRAVRAVRVATLIAGAMTVLFAGTGSGAAAAQDAPAVLAPRVVGDAIPAPLTHTPGDPQRGRAIVASRQTGLCLLCHSGPIPEERFQGNLAPDLRGAGARWTEAQLRLRVVDMRRVNPDSLMPAYHRIDGLHRVGAAWRGRPVLDAQQVEDVVAYLAGLRE